MIAMEREYAVVGGGSIRVGSDDLEWPWKGSNFSGGSLSNARSVWPRTTKFCRI